MQLLGVTFGVTFDLGSARIFPTAIFGTYFSYHKDIWIEATDYMYFLPYDAISIYS